MSIRTRLLLLVFAVWLPAVAGFALLAKATYQREAETARQNVEQLARVLNSVVERELDMRTMIARTLSASAALQQSDLPVFHREASAAVTHTDSWAFLVTPDTQLLTTQVPFEQFQPVRRPQGAPWLTNTADVQFSLRGILAPKPVLGVFAPELHVNPPRFNVGVAFFPSVIQAILERHPGPVGGVQTVIDREMRVVARTRDPAKWLGQQATGPLRQRVVRSEHGFAESITLDGVPSLTYLTPPNHHGWHIIIALPKTTLMQAAERATLQALAASAALLAIGLFLALYVSRTISAPILALRGAAAELGQDRVPPQLSTGVLETDAVSGALHQAGVRSHEATRTLETRVALAVQQAEQAQASLLESQKHEAIGRLAGGVAHDFNNLLQTISVALQVMERTARAEPELRVAQAARRACAKAADLVRQMLAFGRVGALTPQPVDFNDFVLRSRELAGKALGEQFELTAEIEPGLPALFVDPTQLELALLNMIFNARDAMPQGGRICLVGRTAEPHEVQGLPSAGPMVRIEVQDNGPGMDGETAARAFDPYFTTKPVGRGSGLGLAQVRAFAHGSGGEARLQSAPGAGTRVVMLLPASERPAAQPALPGAAITVSAPLRITMVEDDILVSSVVAPALRAMGHKVSLHRNADEAAEALAAGEVADVLFTDVVMPGSMNGLDLVAWCAVHRPGLPCVVATGYTAQESRTTAQILRKPYQVEQLLAVLASATAPGRPPAAPGPATTPAPGNGAP